MIAKIVFDKRNFFLLYFCTYNCRTPKLIEYLMIAFSKPLKKNFKSMFLFISVCGGYPTLSSWPEVVPTPGSGSSRWRPGWTRRPAHCRLRRTGSKSRHKSKTRGPSNSGTILSRKTTLELSFCKRKFRTNFRIDDHKNWVCGC